MATAAQVTAWIGAVAALIGVPILIATNRQPLCDAFGVLCTKPSIPAACGPALLGPLLANIDSSGSNVSVRICREGTTCDAGPFRLGDPVTFIVESAGAGRALLLDIDSAGKATQLVPNDFGSGRAAKVGPGITLRMPEPSHAFQVKARPPTGKGCAVAFVLPDGADSGGLLFRTFTPPKGLGVVARGDVATLAASASRPMVGFAAYEIVP